MTTFKFEFIKNVRGPLTCTITDTLDGGLAKRSLGDLDRHDQVTDGPRRGPS